MTGYTIGQIAKQTGVTVEALRFYEKQGLLAKPIRSPSGYRMYSDDIVRRVQFIQRAKLLGFSLKEIVELLNLRRTHTTTCADVKQVAEIKITHIDHKLKELQHMRSALTALAAQCDVVAELTDCPILDALDHASTKQLEPTRTLHDR